MAAATEPKVYPASEGNPSEYAIKKEEVTPIKADEIFREWKEQL